MFNNKPLLRQRRFTSLLFIGLAFATLACIAANLTCIIIIRDNNMNIQRYRQMLMILNDIEHSVYKAEIAHRDFLLSKDENEKEKHLEFIDDLRKKTKTLEKLVVHDNKQTHHTEEEDLFEKIQLNLKIIDFEMQMTLKLIQDRNLDEIQRIQELGHALSPPNLFKDSIEQLNHRYNQQLNSLIVQRSKITLYAQWVAILTPLILFGYSFTLWLILKKKVLHLTSNEEKCVNKTKEIDDLKEQHRHSIRTLLNEYQTELENFRYNLSREIHDEFGSVLTASKMDIDWAIKQLHQPRSDVVDKLEKTKNHLIEGLSFHKRLVEELYPSTLNNLGLLLSLQGMIEDVATRNHLRLTLTLPEDMHFEFDHTISIVAYRVVQESLNNIIKHANASELNCHIICDLDFLKIELQDNGIGLNSEESAHKGHGVHGMKNRILALGGHFEMRSQPNLGVYTCVLIPIRPNID